MGWKMAITQTQDRSSFFGFFPDPDHSLVEASKAGDVKAFQRLTEGYGPRLSRLAQRITKNREDAEDAVQDALLQGFLHLRSFRGDGHFFYWLRRILINQALMLTRRKRTNEYSFDEVFFQADTATSVVNRRVTPEQAFRQQERVETTLALLGSMKPELRVALRMHAVEERSLEEIALTLGLSISAVKSRIHRARIKLRKAMRLQRIKSCPVGQSPSGVLGLRRRF
jgi:RNA polymerase sigma-70 factor, ECF subfamily